MMLYYAQRLELFAEIRAARMEAEDAQRRADEARERLKRLTVRERHHFGIYRNWPLADLARAAGVSRKTLYAWIDEAERSGE